MQRERCTLKRSPQYIDLPCVMPPCGECNGLGNVCVLLQTLASDGIKGLFKGMGAPLATVALFNAILFATRGQMERILAHSDGTSMLPVLASLVSLIDAAYHLKISVNLTRGVASGVVAVPEVSNPGLSARWYAGSALTVGDQAVAGMGAGVAVSFLACPTELLKCRLQAQGDAAKSGEVGTMHLVSKLAPAYAVYLEHS